MNVLSVTKDHAVQVGGTGAPQKVTVLAGDAIWYSTDRNGPIVGTILVGDSLTFDQSAWMQTPSLSDIRVEEATQPSLAQTLEEWQEVQLRGFRAMAPPVARPKFRAPTWAGVTALVVVGAGWLAGILGAVGVLH